MNSEIELIPFIKQALINIESKEFKRTNSTDNILVFAHFHNSTPMYRQ